MALDASTDAGADGRVNVAVCEPTDGMSDDAFARALSNLRIRVSGTEQTLSLDEMLRIGGIPGVSIAIKRPGEAPLAVTRGSTNGSGATLNADTLFQAASISKAVTALALFGDASDLSWMEEDVRPAVPAISSSHEVTPAMLLSHTSGANVHGFLGYLPTETIPTLDQILRGGSPTNSDRIRFGSSGTFSYSGGGYTVLQAWMLSRNAGLSHDAYLRSRIFEPANLRRTLVGTVGTETNFSCGKDSEYLPNGECHRVYPELAAAGLWTTASELTCVGGYAAAHQATALQKISSITLDVDGEYTFGYGMVHRRNRDGSTLFEHSGANVGYCADWIFFDDGRSIAFMENTCTGVAEPVIRSICRELGWPCSGEGYAEE